MVRPHAEATGAWGRLYNIAPPFKRGVSTGLVVVINKVNYSVAL